MRPGCRPSGAAVRRAPPAGICSRAQGSARGNPRLRGTVGTPRQGARPACRSGADSGCMPRVLRMGASTDTRRPAPPGSPHRDTARVRVIRCRGRAPARPGVGECGPGADHPVPRYGAPRRRASVPAPQGSARGNPRLRGTVGTPRQGARPACRSGADSGCMPRVLRMGASTDTRRPAPPGSPHRDTARVRVIRCRGRAPARPGVGECGPGADHPVPRYGAPRRRASVPAPRAPHAGIRVCAELSGRRVRARGLPAAPARIPDACLACCAWARPQTPAGRRRRVHRIATRPGCG